eukprot:4071975-Prymnesium_polylepis.1
MCIRDSLPTPRAACAWRARARATHATLPAEAMARLSTCPGRHLRPPAAARAPRLSVRPAA